MPATRIALATCASLPSGHVDDAQLAAELGAEWVTWDDRAVDWNAFDLVVVRSTWDYTARLEEYLAWAHGVPRLVNPAAVLAWNSDKRYLDELAATGLPVVATTFVAPGEAFVAPAGEYVVKPSVSAGSRDTLRFAPGDEERAAALVERIHTSRRTAMVQPYVASVDERGETALLCFDGELSHAIAKGRILTRGDEPIEGLLDFPEPSIAAREASSAERALAEGVVAWLAERFGGPLAYARVDVVTGDDGEPLLLELEVTEPLLFLRQAEGSATRFAAALRRRLS